jgi:uncharacterized OsmC-like protein
MATDPAHREVSVGRVTGGRFTAATSGAARSPSVPAGDADCTPTELLLAAIGGCTAIDVDILTSRRAEPEAFQVDVAAGKVRDAAGNHLADIEVTLPGCVPGGGGGDAARALLPDAVRRSHDRLCTVSRTIELGIPVTSRVQAG